MGLLGLGILGIMAVAGCGKEPVSKDAKPEMVKEIEKESPKSKNTKLETSVKTVRTDDLKNMNNSQLQKLMESNYESVMTLDKKLETSRLERVQNKSLGDSAKWKKENVQAMSDMKAHIVNLETINEFVFKNSKETTESKEIHQAHAMLIEFFTLKSDVYQIGYKQILKKDFNYKSDELSEKAFKVMEFQKILNDME